MRGSIAWVSTSGVRDTTGPASRIAASWPGVLIWIGVSRLVPMAPPESCVNVTRLAVRPEVTGSPKPPGRASRDEAPQRAQGAVGDLLHRPGGIDPEQDALVRVEGDQRLRLVLVHVQPVPDRLFPVIVALEERPAAVVTPLAAGRRVQQHVPDPPPPPASRTPACASSSANLLATIAIVISSGTRSPRSI